MKDENLIKERERERTDIKKRKKERKKGNFFRN